MKPIKTNVTNKMKLAVNSTANMRFEVAKHFFAITVISTKNIKEKKRKIL